jgi:CDP-glucose 4,6-dehydratase
LGQRPGAMAGLVVNQRRIGTIADLRKCYAGKRVLVTGHTGFKGSWLASWLSRLGADVHGLSLPPPAGRPSLFIDADLSRHCSSHILDIRDAAGVQAAFSAIEPEFVFHLAARALVQQGYEDPLDTFAVNVMGTANVLEAARTTSTIRAVVCVTTDKVYRNREWASPYRETDELGGLDAYAASKAAAELVARAYRNALKPVDRPARLATARGGNVIGGGDFSPHRLVPDIVRALSDRAPLILRNPHAVRPWQHVLDLCHAYLRLGQALAEEAIDDVDCLNFGPAGDEDLPVRELVDIFLAEWGDENYAIGFQSEDRYEATTLKLDSSLAKARLGWKPMLDLHGTVQWAARWYRAHSGATSSTARLVEDDLIAYELLVEKAIAA